MCETKDRTRCTGVVFLTLAALAQVFVMLSYVRGILVMQHYVSPLIFAFTGMTLFAGRYGKRLDYWLGVAFAFWYVVSRMLLKELYLNDSFLFFTNLCCAYLLAFPFAHTMDDVQRRTGLKAAAAVFVAGYGLMAWLSVLGALLGGVIVLPWLGTELGVSAELSRLVAGSHPNISGCLFLIAMMLGVWLIAQKPRRSVIVPVALLGIGLYIAVALTVSRTVMLQVSCLAAGLVVLGALRLRIPALWKRLAIGLLAGALCAALMFVSFGWVVDGVAGMSNGLRASAETVQETAAPTAQPVVENRSLAKDLATMTGRTDIYRSIAQLIKDRPSVLLAGMRNSELVQVLHQYIDNEHTHNSFLQTLVNMGLPAMLLAIWFATRALWVSIRLVFSSKASFADQVLAVALLVLLVGTIPEPYLFSEYLTACNMPFFLMLGYAIETERKLR